MTGENKRHTHRPAKLTTKRGVLQTADLRGLAFEQKTVHGPAFGQREPGRPSRRDQILAARDELPPGTSFVRRIREHIVAKAGGDTKGLSDRTIRRVLKEG